MATANPLENLTMAERFRIARLRAKISQAEAALAAQRYLPEWTPMSREVVRRLEAGLIPEGRMNSLQVLALGRVYGVDPRWLKPIAADDIAKISDLLGDGGGAGSLTTNTATPGLCETPGRAA